MRFLLPLLIVLATPSVTLAQSCTAYGAATICDNGFSGNRVGPDGISSNRPGTAPLLDDGSKRFNSMSSYNDGTVSYQYGNTIIFNDGRVCHRYGNHINCY